MVGRPCELGGRVAVVTGAGRGIGAAIARAYAGAGARVVCAARTPEQLDRTVEQIAGAGGEAIAVPTDVTRLDQVEALFDRAAAAFGGIDVVVLNAGGDLGSGPVADSDPERWRATIELNLLGAYHGARAAIGHLKRRGGGKILTVGSGIGHRGTPEYSAYACAKAGLWMLTRVLAQELRESGISVNELIPGPVVADPARREELQLPPFSGEWVKGPDDVVPLALFLASQPEPGPTAQSFSLMRRDG